MASKLKYAYTNEGKLVHIDTVPKGNDCGCVCPACKQPLQAKNAGPKRDHHFAHQPGVDCPGALETVLHLLAKERIQKAFYENDVFNIEYEYHSYCKDFVKCKYVRYEDCLTTNFIPYDLKKFYDSCEQEIPYDNLNRRSDLKIWSKANPKRQPIYIEFCVTHQSDTEKLHSGRKIIEVKIENEDDINNIVSNGFSEKKLLKPNNGDPVAASKISFWGFKDRDYDNTTLYNTITFSRYILYQSGKFQCYQDSCQCNELKKVKRNSLCEICFHTEVAFGIHELAKWIGYEKYGIKNCLLCTYYVDCYDGSGKICCRYKSLGLSRYEQHDNARAKTCKLFILNKEEMIETLNDYHNGKSVPITEL